MLEQLAKKDSYWRKIALKICNNKMLADDLVNDMYLALNNCNKEINDFYVIVTIKNLFLQELKNNKSTDLNDNFTSDAPFELDDQEKKIIDNVYWVAKEYIEMNETMSVREIGKVLNTNYNFVHHTIKKEKLKWQKEKITKLNLIKLQK